MRGKMFRLLSVLLASTMIVSSVSTAFADEEVISTASYAQEVQTADDNAENTAEDTNISDDQTADSSISEDQTADSSITNDQTTDTSISDAADDENKEAENNEDTDVKEETASASEDNKKENGETDKASKEEVAENEVKSESNTTPEDEISLASDSAPEGDPVKPTASITGLSVVRNNGAEYGMFPVSNASYEVKGGKIQISFTTPGKKVFTRLYLGYCTDENKEPYFDGTVNGRSTEFTIEVPLEDSNSWIPIAVWRPDKVDDSGNVKEAAHWYIGDYLWMSIPNVTNITTQPSNVSAKVGDTASLSVAADGEALTYKWQYSEDNNTWSDCTGESADKAEYSFEMAESSEGYYRCVVSGSYGSATSEVAKVSLASNQEGYSYNSKIIAVYSNNTVINKAAKIGTEYTMFRIAESSLKVTGSNILVNIGVNPAASGKFSYSDIAVYTEAATSKADLASKAESGQIVSGSVDTDKNLQFYSFTIPLSCVGSEVYFIPKSASKGTWSASSELAFKIPALSEFTAPSKIEITKQPQDVIAVPGVETSLSVEASGDEELTLSYKWQYSTDGKSWSDCEGDSAKTASYSFTMSDELAGKYRCVVSDETGTEVISDSASVSVPKAPVVTGDKVRVVKDDATDFKMFTVDESEVTSNGDSLEVTFTTKNYSFDKIYFGYKDVADKASESDIIKGTQTEDGGYKFTFTVPASYKGKVLPLALNKQKDGSWYTGAYLWIYIPDEGISETVDTDISAVYGGTGADVKSEFAIESSKAVLKSDSIVLTLNVSGNKYNKLYLGTQAETKGNDATCIGSYDEDKNITSYTFEIPRDKQGMYIAITPGNSSGWFSYARDIFIKIPNFDNVSATSENGIYDLYGSAFPTNNVIGLCFERESSLKIENGKATVTLITQASSYDKLYIGDVSDSDSVKEENAVSFTDRKDIGDAYRSATFEISLSDLGKDIKYVVRNAKTGAWNTKQSLFKINDILNKTGDIVTPTATPTAAPTETPTVTPTETPTVTPTKTPSNVPADGIYTTTAETGAAMFKVVDVELTVKNGKMTAKITMSGTGNKLLYMGLAADAPNHSSDWISPCGTVCLSTGSEGYQFEIPVSALDTKISLASKGREKWYDRTITISSANLKKTGDIDPDNPTTTPVPTVKPTAVPTAAPTAAPDNNPDKESTYTPDTNGSTSAVDNSTKLRDGVYTPDSFTYTGGTGKVTITCTKITITNGQAYATLVFSSAKYGYVKANGNTYYPTVSGKTSTFTIPVELNKNNKIIGMTTAMTQAHEIEYTIFIYLAAANNSTAGDSTSGLVSTSNKELDKTAPEIVGLTYESETKLENAEYFKIYNYEDGIVLLEIDTTKDTANDPDKASDKTTESTDKTKSDSTSSNSSKKKTDEVILEDEIEQQESNGQVTSEDTAKLYKENVVKYLIVPDGADVPVGLDKDMIVIHRQKDEDFSAFVSSMEALGFMKELDSLDVVSALGLTKTEVSADKDISGKLNIKEAEKTTTNKKSKTTAKSKTSAKSTDTKSKTSTEVSDDEVYTAGSQNAPDYKQIVKSKVNLTILGSDILPKENEETKTDSIVETLTADEQNDIYNDVTEKMATLGIPAIIDRSQDEKSELAKYEWIKVYGAIFGKSDDAQKLYDEKVKNTNEKGAADEKNTK